MVDERDFLIIFSEHARMRVRIRRDRKIVTEFLVQLETFLVDEWRAVIRYDNAHGRPHLDVMDRWGREKQKYWLPGSTNDVLTAGMKDIAQHWEEYVSRFLEN